MPIYTKDLSARAPYHAHVYFTDVTQPVARALQEQLRARLISDRDAGLLVVEELDETAVGPHPLPQFEIHCYECYLPALLPLLEQSPLISVVHPVTDDDLADHTVLAQWIHGNVELDLSVLDPPGQNKALARFGKPPQE
ncbi:MAG: DOPA 4,5-dioxygenase family protein [Pseudomonadota bacterium]